MAMIYIMVQGHGWFRVIVYGFMVIVLGMAMVNTMIIIMVQGHGWFRVIIYGFMVMVFGDGNGQCYIYDKIYRVTQGYKAITIKFVFVTSLVI